MLLKKNVIYAFQNIEILHQIWRIITLPGRMTVFFENKQLSKPIEKHVMTTILS